MKRVEARHITTTGSIEGWSIRSYCGPVVAHSVSGAGLVTEFFAGFSDVFGGKSQAIRNRLDEVYGAAIDELASAAARLGANWIVGLRVDTGDVSGKGTMMFMVTVTGTAVAAEPSVGEGAPMTSDALTVDQLRREVARQQVAAIDDLEPHAKDPNKMRLIVEQRVPALAPLFLRWTREHQFEELRDVYTKRFEWALAYFGNLEPDEASRSIYASVVIPSRPALMCETEILERLNLLDLARSCDLLTSGDARRRWWGLQTLRARRGVYRPADIECIDRCLQAFAARPWDVANLVEVKRLLGRRQVWTCVAGHENDAAVERCTCGLDRRGLLRENMTPEAAVAHLQQLRAILNAAFGRASSTGA